MARRARLAGRRCRHLRDRVCNVRPRTPTHEGWGTGSSSRRTTFPRAFPRAAFDLVSAQFLHSTLPLDRTRIFQRAADVIRPGGLLLIVDHGGAPPWASKLHHHHEFPSADEVVAALDLPDAEWETSAGRARSNGRRQVRTGRTERWWTTSLFCVVASSPLAVAVRQAPSAGPVTRRDGGRFVGEEDAMTDVAAVGDRTLRRRTVQATVDPASRDGRREFPAVRTRTGRRRDRSVCSAPCLTRRRGTPGRA